MAPFFALFLSLSKTGVWRVLLGKIPIRKRSLSMINLGTSTNCSKVTASSNVMIQIPAYSSLCLKVFLSRSKLDEISFHFILGNQRYDNSAFSQHFPWKDFYLGSLVSPFFTLNSISKCSSYMSLFFIFSLFLRTTILCFSFLNILTSL